MIDDDAELAGGCRCGAVRFRAAGRPLWTAHCHCGDCRRSTSAAFATYAGFRADRFSWTRGRPKTFASSPGVRRSFCAECGTPLAYEGERWPGEIHVHVCACDRPELFAPQAHVYVAERVPWVHLSDGLRQFQRTAKSG